ncbi:MAG: hypothetical protein M3O26_11670 [Pseudomonadota bacterium]|nr:hypothetical protein [Pseudomonadota bacterium]
MSRTRRNPFATNHAPHYVVTWDLQWQVIDCRSLGRGADLRAALSGAIERLQYCGWRPEGGLEFGFVFVTRVGERRLVTITERDPFSETLQSFSPFGDERPY